MFRLITLFASLLFPAVAVAASSGGPVAGRVTVVEPEFRVAGIDVLESMPPQFELVLRRDMPTAGWSLAVERVVSSAEDGRVRIELVETAPDGMVAQVITPVEVRVGLGSLSVGRHVVELWLRRDGRSEAVPVQAVIVTAHAK